MKRMMIVDDHSAFGQALELALGKTNDTEVVLSRTVEEGGALIRGNGRFDLAVLDLMLPDGEGTELVAEVKRHHPDVPVAILSARDDVAEVTSEAGVDATISKATPLPVIISTLERLTG
jgi:two-component system response regulator PilR (NtrC family)